MELHKRSLGSVSLSGSVAGTGSVWFVLDIGSVRLPCLPLIFVQVQQASLASLWCALELGKIVIMSLDRFHYQVAGAVVVCSERCLLWKMGDGFPSELADVDFRWQGSYKRSQEQEPHVGPNLFAIQVTEAKVNLMSIHEDLLGLRAGSPNRFALVSCIWFGSWGFPNNEY